MSSIRLRLLKWLIGPILVINLAGGALTYLLAWMPAQSAFDQSLFDAAGALCGRVTGGADGARVDLPPQAEQMLRSNDADATYFVVRANGGAGAKLAGDADFPAPHAGAELGLPYAYDATMRAEPVRVVSVRLRVGGHTLQVGVAKTLRKRLQTRAAIVRALVLLEALFSAALVGLIWFSVTTGLLPLNRMRADLNARDAADLSPIQDDAVPFELGPVVSAFNDLLAKVQAGARAQHDFLANVAHQLRTPLAGLKMQLEWQAERHAAEPETSASIARMLSATERMIRQTNQLLALARAEPSYFEKTRLERLDLAALVQDAIQQFVDQASLKGIDLGFDLLPSPMVGDRFLLRDLIDNLIDNALRYTPAHGSVTVSCYSDAGAAVFMVEDSGPGIAPSRREHVFARFVRLDDKTTGSGLGLAIVRDIAQAHGASVTLGDGAGAKGCLLTVRFPG